MSIVHRLANLHWVAVVLFPLTVILMEVCWVYPWLAWVGKWQVLGWQRSPLGLASLILLLGISFFVTRFFLSRKWLLPWIQLSIISCGLVVIFMVVRVEYSAGFSLLSGQWFVHTARLLLDSFSHPHPMVMGLVAGAYLWWRGISRGRSSLYFDDIYRSFVVGLTALVVLIIVLGVSSGAGSLEDLASTAGLHVAGFFFFGLTALALGNLQAVREKMIEKEGVAPVFGRRWLSSIVGVIGGIVVVGISTASIFSTEFLTLLGQLLNLAYDLLLKALYYLFIPLGYLVAGLVYAAQFIINWLRGGQPPRPFQPSGFSESEALVEGTATQTLSAEATLAIKWTFLALVAAAVVFLLVKAISHYSSFRAKAEIEEIHESLWSWEGFKADLCLFFSMILQHFKRKRKERARVSPVPSWYLREDVQGTLSIREIYRRLLWQASYSRIARRYHETPYEYARRLGQAVPDGSMQLSELTNLYINVRYGDLEAEHKQVDYANSLWRILQRLLGKLERNQAE